jgi:hypothetical protein
VIVFTIVFWGMPCTGAPVDSKYIDVLPTSVCMTEQHIIVASEDTLYSWQYRTSVSKLTSVRTACLPACLCCKHLAACHMLLVFFSEQVLCRCTHTVPALPGGRCDWPAPEGGP